MGSKSNYNRNVEVIKKKCRYVVKNVSQPKLVSKLKSVAQRIVNEIDTITSIPNYTGNLRDSHGVGVYVNGTLNSYIPTKTAIKSQRCGLNGRKVYNIWGTEYLQDALSDATSDFSDGIWIVLFASVPYAFHVNATHVNAGFFDDVANKIVDEVTKGLIALKVKEIPNITRYGGL